MNLNSSILVSVIIHLIIVLILPGFNSSQLMRSKPYIEVSLLPPPKMVKKRAAPVAPKKKPAGTAKWQALAPQLPGRGRYSPTRPLQPPIKLPTAIADKQDILNLLPEQAFSMDELIKTPLSVQPSVKTPFKVPAVVPESSPQSTPAEISWSGPPRRYLYKPPDPVYSSPIEGEVKLKFWVDPPGNVTNVVVLRKLDAQLERLAIDYMKRWRFEPLKGKDSKQQWGTIDIRFKLE
jgi:TonB family protein